MRCPRTMGYEILRSDNATAATASNPPTALPAMPRRRLYGETQKRRKKPTTRLLKRVDTPVRVQATQQPAPFERSDVVEREDLEFLEAMRELEVRRGPWRGESQARRQAVERVQFLADDHESALFLNSMARQGVTPLGEAGRQRSEPRPHTESGADAPAEPPQTPPAPAATAGRAPDARAQATPPPTATPEHGAPAGASSGNGTPPATADPVEFAADADAAELMEALLHGDDFQPELKFAGAAAPPRRAGKPGPAWEHDEAEPDDELDLHGKTQEEAIRMVQGFLLVAQRRGLRHVLIITGRGRNSGEAGPVLKESVQRWLELNGKRFVRAWTRAPGHLGGEGALWVTLR